MVIFNSFVLGSSGDAMKKAVGSVVSTGVEVHHKVFGRLRILYLEVAPPNGFFSEYERVAEIARVRFAEISNDEERNRVYEKVWELAKMQDSTIDGFRWGETHVFDDMNRLATALHRLGLLIDEENHLHPLPCLSYEFGEGGLGSQYFSLSEKAGKDPLTGHIGFVNGMGIPSLEHAGRDAAAISDRYTHGNNLHCVYHATHQKNFSGDGLGFIQDVFRMKAVDGGSYTKTSYLIAQQWLDFLNEHPGKNYLQIAASEGAAHLRAALRIIQEAKPNLLVRLRVIALCPAYFIDPQRYPGLQAINLVKMEDTAILPWASNTRFIGFADFIKVVRHTTVGDPHDFTTLDYADVGRPFVEEFMRTGNIYQN